MGMEEVELMKMIKSEQFESAYGLIGELGAGCYGSKVVNGKWHVKSHDGTPLTDENIDAVLDAPFDDTWTNPFEFKNFGEALDFVESVFRAVREQAENETIDCLAIRRLFQRESIFPFVQDVHPLSMRRKNPPPDAERQDVFWRSTLERLFEE